MDELIRGERDHRIGTSLDRMKLGLMQQGLYLSEHRPTSRQLRRLDQHQQRPKRSRSQTPKRGFQ